MYTDRQAYVNEVLNAEETEKIAPFGESFAEIELRAGMTDLRRICLTNPHFQNQNVYLQALLPFFIEGATPLAQDPNWHYFLLYSHASKKLLAMFTVYEAHLTLEKVRAKVSQVLVLQPYQR